MGYYDYENLLAKYLNTRSDADLENLAEWFSHYGMSYWTGECWKAEGFCVYPVYEEAEDGEYEIVRYRAE